jgi:hypothetical protein
MNPMLEPFLYETARERQSELKASARAVAVPAERTTPRWRRLRLWWRTYVDRVTAMRVVRGCAGAPNACRG